MSSEDMDSLISDSHIFAINALWGRRLEDARIITRKWISLIARFQTIDTLVASWGHFEIDKGVVAFNPNFDEQLARVRSGTEVDNCGKAVASAGTNLWLSNEMEDRSLDLQLRVRAGVDYPGGGNAVSLQTSLFERPDPRLLQYRIFRGLLLAAAETFEASHGVVWSADITKLWAEPRGISQTLDLGWMSYVSPRFAPLGPPPPTVISERRPDGGLFMAATTEVFSTDNPAHLAAAQRIRDSLDAYNAVPWTTETGK